jgi:NADH-quinone oxidoreductase subunit H
VQNLAKYFSTNLNLFSGMSEDTVNFILILVVCLLVLAFLSIYAGVTSVVERKVAGRIQTRFGPNKVFFRGLFQFLADGIKNIQKEDIIPDNTDKPLFRIAPYIVFMGMFLSWVALPFGKNLIAADLNIGILYIFAVTSLNVIGLLMAGWASNNKWSLIGGIRSAAQIVSYEIPSGLAALTIILLTGSLSMQSIIENQGAMPWQWNIAHNPFTTIAFFIMVTSLLAEGNRTPFDIPEAESELVSGYNTEYSGMRFLFFFFAEWANIWIMSAILTTLFLGGWQSPFYMEAVLLGQRLEVSGILLFALKALVLTFVVIWIRWTLPRLRVDQMMTLCWKYLIPMGFVNILGVLIWMVVFPKGNVTVPIIINLFFLAVLVIFFYRVIYINLIKMKAKLDLNPFQ